MGSSTATALHLGEAPSQRLTTAQAVSVFVATHPKFGHIAAARPMGITSAVIEAALDGQLSAGSISRSRPAAGAPQLTIVGHAAPAAKRLGGGAPTDQIPVVPSPIDDPWGRTAAQREDAPRVHSLPSGSGGNVDPFAGFGF